MRTSFLFISLVLIGGALLVLLILAQGYRGFGLTPQPLLNNKEFSLPEPPYFVSFKGEIKKTAADDYEVSLKPFFFVSATGTNPSFDWALRDAEYQLVLKKKGKVIAEAKFDAFHCEVEEEPCPRLVRGEGEFLRTIYEVPELPEEILILSQGKEVYTLKAEDFSLPKIKVKQQLYDKERKRLELIWEEESGKPLNFQAYVFNESFQSPIPVSEGTLGPNQEVLLSKNSFVFPYQSFFAQGTLQAVIYATNGFHTLKFASLRFKVE